jgi:hypothetical protein
MSSEAVVSFVSLTLITGTAKSLQVADIIVSTMRQGDNMVDI